MLPKKASSAPFHHDAACECLLCQQRKTDINLKRMQSLVSLSQPLTKGNSDPFAVSPFPITAKVNEYLQLGSQFYVLWAWPVYTSALFRERAHGDWEGSVRISFRQPSEMHAMLAGGAYVRAERFPSLADKDVVRATSHQMQAMSLLRKSLMDKDPKGSAALLWTVLRLLALEFYTGNFDAARWHHNAAKQIIRYHKFPDWHYDSQLTFFVAEVWICTALLQKPASMERQCGAGPTPEEPLLDQPDVKLLSESMDTYDVHEAVPTELRETFLDIRKVVVSMQLLKQIKDEEQKFEIVAYLDIRAAILKARLLALWTDNNTRHRGASLFTNNIIFSACSMAALAFVNMIFMFPALKPDNDAFSLASSPAPATGLLHKTFSVLRQDLSQLLRMWKMSSQTVDSELILWLCFIATLADPACSTWRSNTSNSASISEALNALKLESKSSAKSVLTRFSYHEALMDEYTEELATVANSQGDGRVRNFAFQQLGVHLRD